jgi:hypothetical protein
MKKILLSVLSVFIVLVAFSQSQFELQSVSIYKAGSQEAIKKVIPPLNPVAKFIDFDSLNMSYAGSWSFGPSNCIASSPTGDTVFIGSGGGVIIMDATDPYNPVKLSEVHARALVDYLHYSPEEGRLYLAAYHSGLEIWDVSDIQNPFRISRIGTSGLPRGGVYAKKPSPPEGTYVYLVTVADGIDVFSINDQGYPSFVGNQSFTSQWVFNSVGSGNSLYLAAGSGGAIGVDLSQPPPNMNSSFTIPGNAKGIAVNENQLNVVNNNSGLKIYDFTEVPATLLGELIIEGNPYRIALAENNAYVSNSTNSTGGGIDIVDISDPSSPFLTGFYDSPQTYIAGSQDAVYATGGSGGCLMLDVTDPENPQYAAEYKLPGWTTDIAIQGDYAYIGSKGFRVFDVSDKSHPVQVGYTDTDASHVKVNGDKAVYCQDLSSQNKVFIMDISDPTNTTELGHYLCPAMAQDLDLKGNYAFVACWWDGIRIIDYSDPENPVLANHLMGWVNGAIPGEEFIYCGTLDVEGDYLYAVDYGPFPEDDSRGLYIFDISDPANPELVLRYADIDEGTLRDIEVSNGYAYMTSEGGALVVVSVVDPLFPSQIAYLQLEDVAKAVDVFNDYAFVANYINGGVKVIDISNPFFPEVVGYYKQTGCFALNVTYDAGHVFVADGLDGMQIYNFDLLTGMETKEENIGSLNAFPNPARDRINISSEINGIGNVHLAIYDLTGRIVAEQKISQTTGYLNTYFNVSDLPRGVYLLKLSGDQRCMSKKIMLQ